MISIETQIFTEDVLELLSDEEYAEFQKYLADNPLAGDVIQQLEGSKNSDGRLKEKVNVVNERW